MCETNIEQGTVLLQLMFYCADNNSVISIDQIYVSRFMCK